MNRYLYDIFAASCFILIVVMPAFAASPSLLSTPMSSVVRVDVKTGKLIRTVPSSHVARAITPDLNDLIERIATEQGVEAPLVHSVILTESNYNPLAVSPKGAIGMMQLIPSTAKRFGVTDAFNVAQNIQGGVRYLKFLLDYYKNDYTRTIAAYNAGEGAVDKFHGIPPFAETQNYVSTVAHNLKAARAKHETKVASAAPLSLAGPDDPKPVIAFTGADGKLYYRTP